MDWSICTLLDMYTGWPDTVCVSCILTTKCVVFIRSVRAKHFLIHEDGVVKLSGLRSVVSMIEDGARVKVGVIL